MAHVGETTPSCFTIAFLDIESDWKCFALLLWLVKKRFFNHAGPIAHILYLYLEFEKQRGLATRLFAGKMDNLVAASHKYNMPACL